ncbi:MAG TPA: DUF3465 domain-containing protein [Psychromonas hadalis]|nr:DUF3465 domain-containing protein [Psychromonas hadalis]
MNLEKGFCRLKVLFTISLLALLSGCFSDERQNLDSLYGDGNADMDKLLDGVDHITYLFNNQRGGEMVSSLGRIIKLLEDQTSPYLAQLILIRLNSGQKLIIKHNLKASTKIADLKVGEMIKFKGVYRWNSRGGMVVSTFENKQHPKRSGWVKFADKTYQ